MFEMFNGAQALRRQRAGVALAASLPDLLHRLAFILTCALPLLLAMGRAPADIAASLLGLLLLLHSAFTGHWKWLRVPEFFLPALMWVYLVAAAPMGGDSLFTALAWVRFPLCFAAVVWAVPDRQSMTRLSVCALSAAALSMVDAYWQYATGVSLSGHPMQQLRLTGPLSNANIGNLLLKLTLPAAGWLAYHSMGQRRALWAVLAVACGVAALIPLTGERSITLLELAGIAVTGTALALRNPTLRKAVYVGAVVLALGAAAVSTQGVVRLRAHELVGHITHFWASPYGQIYTAAFDMWRQHPLFGVGIHRFFGACLPLVEAHVVDGCDIHAHNVYLQWLSEGGLVGLALFVAFVAVVFRQWWRVMIRLRGNAVIAAAAAGGTLTVLLWPVIVTQNMFSNWAGVLFWFTLAVAQCTIYNVQLTIKNAR